MQQEEECWNEKGIRSYTQNVEQERKNHGGIGEWQHMNRSFKKHNTRGGQAKRHQKNVQNVKRSVAKHWGRESRYA